MEQINLAVRNHEVSVPWDHQELARQLHAWFDIFNAEFFGNTLPLAFLQVERTRRSNLGHYRRSRNGVGALHEINVNELYLHRPLHEVLATLLHEMAHEWQELFGKPGKGRYHNKQFTSKCAALGIPCTGGYRSVRIGLTDPFISLLQQHGVEIVEEKSVLHLDAQHIHTQYIIGTSKLKKWSCGCTNIRAAVEVMAVCQKCGASFQLADEFSSLNAKIPNADLPFDIRV